MELSAELGQKGGYQEDVWSALLYVGEKNESTSPNRVLNSAGGVCQLYDGLWVQLSKKINRIQKYSESPNVPSREHTNVIAKGI